jgi:8-oxo-dGTP diphosphatase
MAGMHDWVVGGALIVSEDGVLLVQNRRRNGSHDWTPPGGVIDEGESLLEGLTREVEEETGLRVTKWAGPVYEVRCVAPDLGWRLRVEAHVALAYEGELEVNDPDGIVVDARFVSVDDCGGLVASAHPWVGEPLGDWLADRWPDDESRPYEFHVAGAALDQLVVTREHR